MSVVKEKSFYNTNLNGEISFTQFGDDLTIEEYAFAKTDLETIVVTPNVKCIKPYAFADNKCLTKVFIENGLNVIDQNLFNGCSNIEVLKIPESVEKIDPEAFRDCKIKTIFYEGKVSKWRNMIGDVGGLNLHVIFTNDHEYYVSRFKVVSEYISTQKSVNDTFMPDCYNQNPKAEEYDWSAVIDTLPDIKGIIIQVNRAMIDVSLLENDDQITEKLSSFRELNEILDNFVHQIKYMDIKETIENKSHSSQSLRLSSMIKLHDMAMALQSIYDYAVRMLDLCEFE